MMCLRKPYLLGAAIALLSASALAQTTIDIYQQDFESPNAGHGEAQCTGFSGNAEVGANAITASYTTPGVPFYQVKTADRYCISKVGDPDVLDTSDGRAGRYAIGFHGAGADAAATEIESIGYIFDPQDYRVLIGEFDASWLGAPVRPNNNVPIFTNEQYGFQQGVNYPVSLVFYEIPVGTLNSAVAIVPAPAYGANAGVRIGSTTQTPLTTLTKTLANDNDPYNGNDRFKLDWKRIDFQVNLSNMAAGSRVMMLMTGLPRYRYLMLDNFDIKASLNVITLPPQEVTVMPASSGDFDVIANANDELDSVLVLSEDLVSNSNTSAGTVNIDPVSGLITFTPVDWFVGSVDVQYRVCDSEVNQTCETGVVTFRVPSGDILVSKILTLPDGVSGSFDFSFSAVCSLGASPDSREFASAILSISSAGSTSIERIPAGANCSIAESLPTAPEGYSWAEPEVSPSTLIIEADGSSTVSVINRLDRKDFAGSVVKPVPLNEAWAVVLLSLLMLAAGLLLQKRKQ